MCNCQQTVAGGRVFAFWKVFVKRISIKFGTTSRLMLKQLDYSFSNSMHNS